MQEDVFKRQTSKSKVQYFLCQFIERGKHGITSLKLDSCQTIKKSLRYSTGYTQRCTWIQNFTLN